MDTEKTRIDFSDAVRAFASIAVVTLHVTFNEDWTSDPGAWWISDAFHSLAKPAVPLFIMISGAFLLDPGKEFSLARFWKGRFSRVLAPFLAWTLVYIIWTLAFWHDWPASQIPARLYEGTVYPHLWFVYMLMGLYLALPVLRRFLAGATQAEIIYFIVIWQVAVSLLPGFGGGGDFVVSTGFTGYFIGGYWLRKTEIRVRPMIIFAAAAALVALNTTTLHVLAARAQGGFDEDSSIVSDSGVLVAILSFLLYYLMRILPYDRGLLAWPPVARAIKFLSVGSYGLYLGHILILRLFREGRFGFRLSGWTITPLLGIPLTTVCAVIATLILLSLLNRVPYVRVLAPMAKSRGGGESRDR